MLSTDHIACISSVYFIPLRCYVTDFKESCKNVSCPPLSVCVENETDHPTCECIKGYTYETSDSGPLCKGLFFIFVILDHCSI